MFRRGRVLRSRWSTTFPHFLQVILYAVSTFKKNIVIILSLVSLAGLVLEAALA